MTTSYPGALDAFTNPSATDATNSVTVPHHAQHANANDAIAAVQAELGTDPSGSYSTVKARLDAMAYCGCKALRTTSQTLANSDYSSSAFISFTSESWDTDAIHDNSTNPSRFTVPTGKGGKWCFEGWARFAANTTGFRQLAFYINGSDPGFADVVQHPVQASGIVTDIQLISTFDLTAGDYVQLLAAQSSGGNLNITSAALTARRVS